MLPDTSEIESYSRKTKVFTFDGLDAGTTPGRGGRPTRQIRGGPSWRPTRRVLIAPGHSWNDPRSNFIDFLTVRSGIEKSVIFRIASKRPKWRYQSTFGRPRYVFFIKKHNFRAPFSHRFFDYFRKWRKCETRCARATGLSHRIKINIKKEMNMKIVEVENEDKSINGNENKIKHYDTRKIKATNNI